MSSNKTAWLHEPCGWIKRACPDFIVINVLLWGSLISVATFIYAISLFLKGNSLILIPGDQNDRPTINSFKYLECALETENIFFTIIDGYCINGHQSSNILLSLTQVHTKTPRECACGVTKGLQGLGVVFVFWRKPCACGADLRRRLSKNSIGGSWLRDIYRAECSTEANGREGRTDILICVGKISFSNKHS